jgi:hypothetical protein
LTLWCACCRQNIRRFGFLYKAYERNFWYWEFVILARKAVFVVTNLVLMKEGGKVQALAIALTLGISLVIHTRWQPFVYSDLDRLETLSLTALSLTVIAGAFASDVVDSRRDEAAWAIDSSDNKNVTYVLTAICLGLLHLCVMLSMAKRLLRAAWNTPFVAKHCMDKPIFGSLLAGGAPTAILCFPCKLACCKRIGIEKDRLRHFRNAKKVETDVLDQLARSGTQVKKSLRSVVSATMYSLKLTSVKDTTSTEHNRDRTLSRLSSTGADTSQTGNTNTCQRTISKVAMERILREKLLTTEWKTYEEAWMELMGAHELTVPAYLPHYSRYHHDSYYYDS